jgi:hypothetical protein
MGGRALIEYAGLEFKHSGGGIDREEVRRTMLG